METEIAEHLVYFPWDKLALSPAFFCVMVIYWANFWAVFQVLVDVIKKDTLG